MHAYRDQYAQLFNGGRNVVLMAISVDPVDTLAAWARDDEFPFLMASDTGLVAAAEFGAVFDRPGTHVSARDVFVIGPDGKIAYVSAPFREIDPAAYTALGEAVDRIAAPPQ